MVDGRALEGRGLVVAQDSVVWTNAASGETLSASLHEVRQIVFLSRSRGFGDGFMYGLALGGALGGVVGFLAGEDCSSNDKSFCVSRTGGAFLGALVLGVPMGVVGGLAGSGARTKDIFYPTAARSSTSVGGRPARE
jgi:hypothetical protein